jgi:EAL domain-containing protein (putative c-di-GMP-specific phosphodiesterase class I)
VAEETGLIEPIGDWVIGAVCAQQIAWAARGMTPQISVNVSPRQLRRVDFLARIQEHLRVTGADPARIIIELTESAMLQDHDDAEPVLRALHDLGLRLALDDFGSGYSSLSRLREMPMDTLKIDRAFLREVPENPEAAAIVPAILSLARALGRTRARSSRASCSRGRCRRPSSRRACSSSPPRSISARVARDRAQRAAGEEAAG